MINSNLKTYFRGYNIKRLRKTEDDHGISLSYHDYTTNYSALIDNVLLVSSTYNLINNDELLQMLSCLYDDIIALRLHQNNFVIRCNGNIIFVEKRDRKSLYYFVKIIVLAKGTKK